MVDDSFNIIEVLGEKCFFNFWFIPGIKYFSGYLHFVTGGILKCNLVLFGRGFGSS